MLKTSAEKTAIAIHVCAKHVLVAPLLKTEVATVAVHVNAKALACAKRKSRSFGSGSFLIISNEQKERSCH